MLGDYSYGKFGENLKRYRKESKMSQKELAEKLNLSPQTISNYEKGIKNCSLDTLLKIADLFEVSTDDLLF